MRAPFQKHTVFLDPVEITEDLIRNTEIVTGMVPRIFSQDHESYVDWIEVDTFSASLVFVRVEQKHPAAIFWFQDIESQILYPVSLTAFQKLMTVYPLVNNIATGTWRIAQYPNGYTLEPDC